MRKNLSQHLLATLLLIPFFTSGQARINLDFEPLKDQNNPLLLWSMPNTVDVGSSLDSTAKRKGISSLRFEFGNKGRSESFFFYTRSVPIDELRGRIVRAHIWVKANRFKGSYRLYLSSQTDVPGERLGYASSVDSISDNNIWTRVSVQLSVNENATRVAIGMHVQGSGVLNVDGMEIESDGKSYQDIGLFGTEGFFTHPETGTVGDTICVFKNSPIAGEVIGRQAFTNEISTPKRLTKLVGRLETDTLGGKKLTVRVKYKAGHFETGQVKFYLTLLAEGSRTSVYRERYSYKELDVNPSSEGGQNSCVIETQIPNLSFVKFATFGINMYGNRADICLYDIEIFIDDMLVPSDHNAQKFVLSEEQIQWLRASLKPLNDLRLDSDSAETQFLRRFFDGAKIIGLGEVTHGSHEIFSVKSAIVKYLIQRMGYRHFILEADAVAAASIDKYLFSGIGSASDCLKRLGFWVWNTEEILELLQWIRNYNEHHPENTVRFSGIDMQFTGTILKELYSIFKEAPSALETLAKIERAFKSSNSTEAQDRDFLVNKRSSIFVLISDLDLELERMKLNQKSASSLASMESARTVLGLLRQNAYFRYSFEKNTYRDACLADNLANVLKHGEKAVVWAHNSHVSKDSPYGRPMGSWLKERFGADYKSIGFSFSSGLFRGIAGNLIRTVSATDAPDGSFEKFIDTAKLSSSFLHLEGITLNGDNKWLFEHNYFRQAGAVASDSFERQNLTSKYDAIIHIRNSTPTLGLQP